MVVGSIATALGSRVRCEVLTRAYAGTASFQRYPGLSVRRYRNPAPEHWKDYATGRHHVSFPAKACVGVFDVVGSLVPLWRLAQNADLVHVHFPIPLGLSALASRAFARRPLLITVHGNADVYELPPAVAPLTRAVLRRADAVVSVSKDLATHLSDYFGLEQVAVVPNGVDTDLFRPRPRLQRETLYLLSVSRIVPRKNIPVLIAAVDALLREGAQVKLVIAGTGPDSEHVASLASARRDIVRYVGFVDEAKKRELLADSDVFVQLSTREGLSIATLEALACGIPCVVSDLPGVREPIDAGVTGYHVQNPEDVSDVARTLARLIADRARLDEMKRAARQVALERFSLDALANGYWSIYRRLAHQRRW
jgi:glycosyltransferase involved in cell wall biosynthesis